MIASKSLLADDIARQISAHVYSYKLSIQLRPYNCFPFRQCLNNFTKIGDSSRLRFFRTTTGILSRLVAVIVKAYYNFPSWDWDSLCSVRMGNLGRGWSLSPSMDLEAKFITKIFVLFDRDEVTSGPFIMEDTHSLPLSRIWFAPSLLIEMVVVVMVYYGYSPLRHEPRLAI